MITKPHFYSLRSRLGMINPPWKHEGLNIGVEKGAVSILTDEFIKTFEGSRGETYEYPLPESFAKKETMRVIAKHTQKAIALINSTIQEGETQVVVGGDHSVSLASIAAITERVDPATVGVIRIDSHPDILNRKTTTTNNFHGMWFRPFLEEFDEPAIDEIVGNRRLKPEQIVFLGNLDPEEEESRLLAQFNLKVINTNDLRNDAKASQQYITEFLHKYSHVHLNIDIDGFDESVAPATGLPAQHGLLPNDVEFIFDIIRRLPSISVDLVEINPLRSGASQTIALAQLLLNTIVK